MNTMTRFRSFLPWTSTEPRDAAMDRFWKRFLEWDDARLTDFAPTIDVVEGPDAYRLRAELPGVARQDVHVTMSGDVLTIRGEKRHDQKHEEESFWRYESTFGAFERTIRLPQAAPDQKVTAKLTDGVLRMNVAKRKEARSREITID